MRPTVAVRHEDPDHLGFGADVPTRSGLRVEYVGAFSSLARVVQRRDQERLSSSAAHGIEA
jgi:hypothetical protein